MTALWLKGCLPSQELADAQLSGADEVWTLNAQPLPLEKPPTRHFSLHGLREELRCHGRKYFVWLAGSAPTVYLWRDQIPLWDEIVGGALNKPADLRFFPLEAIEKALMPSRRYFTGSFAYMLAYALCLGAFDEVHIVGVEFSDEQLWKSRIKAADWLEEALEDGPLSTVDDRIYLRVINDLRGQGAGDESWARECIMYWSGRLEQAGIRVVTYPSSELFANKWLKTHCKELGVSECGLYGLCECIGG